MVVGFQSYIAAFVEQVFEVEVADKRIVVDGVVAVTDISVDDEPVVEELARQCYFDLYIGKSPLSLRRLVPILMFSLICPSRLLSWLDSAEEATEASSLLWVCPTFM